MKAVYSLFKAGLALVFFLLAGPAFAQAPTAVDDAPPAIAEGGSIAGTFNVLTNDSNPTADPMTAVLQNGPSNADSFNLNANGTFTYIHDGTETSSDSFTYFADNGTQSPAPATVTITINNTNDAPSLSLNGSDAINLGTGDNYVEQGASATDEEDDNATLTANIVIGGDTVNTAVPDAYVVTYNVTDSDGTPAPQITRTVNVTDDDAPVITLTGGTVNLNTGDTYVEPGFSAIDNVDGDISGDVVITGGPIDTSVAATFTLRYNVSDAAGNAAAEQQRTVNVTDGNPPVITLNGAAIVNLTVGDPYNEQGATATDPEEGSVPVTIGGDTVTTNIPGTYVVTYDAQDSSGNNAAQVTRTVNVADDNPPVITLNGAATITIDVGDAWSDPGATATDPEEGAVSVIIGGDTVDPNTAGTYVITYDAVDSAGNDAVQVTRTVIVNSPPTISIIGDNPATIGEGQVYNDAGATASDLEDGDITSQMTTTDTVNTSAPGDYTVTYEVTDSAGTTTTAIRDVTVTPNEPPEITGQVLLETPEETALLLELANFTVTDPDTDPSNFTLIVRDGASYARVGNTITPALDFNGPLSVNVVVNDGIADSQVFPALVTVTPVNDPPQFAGVVPPGLETLEDTSLTIVIDDLQVIDPDNTFPTDFTLTLQPPLPTDNYSLAGPSTITPAENFNGTLNVRATIRDLEASSAPFTIPVQVISVNDLPTLVTPIGPQNAVEDSAFSLDISTNFSDADGEDLRYSAVFVPPLPAQRNISLNPNTGVFSGTPDFEDNDPEDPVYSVTVTAEDPEGEFVTDVFTLTISQLGRANLGLSISVSPATAMPSDELRWTFTTDNPVGPVPGENIELIGSFVGTGLAVGVESGATCTIATQSGRVDFECTVGSLPVGQSVPVVLSTTTSQITEVVAFATAAGALRVPIDPNPANNSAVRAVSVAESFSAGAVQLLGASSVLSLDAGDINNDGALDIVTGTASGQPVQVYLGAAPRESCNCQRDFAASPLSIADTGPNEGVAFGDFDNDGFLDLVIANNGGQADTVYRNDGAGNFSLMATLQPSNARAVAVGDFNNDGDQDVAIAAASPNLVYFGNGNGGFSNPVQLDNDVSSDVAVGRFNSDNRDDLVFSNRDGVSRLYTKNASGTGFTQQDTFNIGDATSVAAADLNNDGLDDVVFGRSSLDRADTPSNPVYINRGNASFGGSLADLGISPTNDVVIGDVSEDGLLDIVFINQSGVHQIWVQDGNGFSLHGEQIIDIDAAAGVMAALGDTDDGDPGGADLALAGAPAAGVGVYLNDSFGNLGRGDTVPPTLILLGEDTVSVPSGTAYVDEGATADDNIDGTIPSSRIQVTNTVNTAIVGNYTVTYNVSDFAGNPATPITRNVTVTPAAGTGGGGGGTFGLPMVIWLVLFVWISAYRISIREASLSCAHLGKRSHK